LITQLSVDLKQKCDEYNEEYEEQQRYFKPAKKIGAITAILAMAVLISFADQFVDVEYIITISIILAIGCVISLIIAIRYRLKADEHDLDGISISALSAYRAFLQLEKYQSGAKLPSKLTKAKKEIEDMQLTITTGWSKLETDNDVIPKLFSSVTDFVNNFDGLLSYLDEKNADLTKIKNTLIVLITFFLDENHPDLTKINDELKKYAKPEKPITPVKEVIQKNKFVKYPLIFAGILAFGALITFITSQFGATEQTQIMVWIMSSSTVAVISFARLIQK